MALSDFFNKYKMRRLARSYAARLPAQLSHDYGASETYTDGQITACVRRAKLPEAGLLMARAKFLPEAVFAEKYGAEQASLRKLFNDSLPRVVSTDEQICGTTDAANVSFPQS